MEPLESQYLYDESGYGRLPDAEGPPVVMSNTLSHTGGWTGWRLGTVPIPMHTSNVKSYTSGCTLRTI